ncbi:DUF1294 domain-containing protein [Desemzia incerta]|uniref:DUF1294 domain-containing protein n=1 Tax=Desemzia incerta TaxID=82801 RepID=UPI0033157A28
MLLVFYFLLVNVWLFILMGIDKKRAQRNQWRISEKSLLLLGLAGGGLGGLLGMKRYRHKTKRATFKFVYGIGFLIMVGSLAYAQLR